MSYNGIDVSQAAENGFYSDGCKFVYGPFIDNNEYTCEDNFETPVNKPAVYSSVNYDSWKQTDFRVQPCNSIKKMLDVMLAARENNNDSYENYNRVIVFSISSLPDTDNDNCDFSDYSPFYHGLSVLFVTTGFLCEIPFTDSSALPCTQTTAKGCLQPSGFADWFDDFVTNTGIHSYVLTPFDGLTAASVSFNFATTARKLLDPVTNWICDG